MADEHEIKPTDFSLVAREVLSSSSSDTEYDTLNLQDIEKILVQKAMDKFDGNISKAAKELGLTRAALYRRLEKFNL
jgi:transcriptional regulator of acetoin/glycerol metabolism